MRDLSDVVLSPGDFAVLAAACKDDPSFPADYDGWGELIQVAERQARERGLHPTPLLLIPEVFVQWCASVEVVPCLDALRAFAILHRVKPGSLHERFADDDLNGESEGQVPPAARRDVAAYLPRSISGQSASLCHQPAFADRAWREARCVRFPPWRLPLAVQATRGRLDGLPREVGQVEAGSSTASRRRHLGRSDTLTGPDAPGHHLVHPSRRFDFLSGPLDP